MTTNVLPPEFWGFALSLAGGAVGNAAARIRLIEEKCDLLGMARNDVVSAVRDLDEIIADEAAPYLVRKMAVRLLHCYAYEEAGKFFARAVFSDRSPPPVGETPLGTAMEELRRDRPELERKAHRAFVTMILGLGIMYLSDELEITRVEREAAKDPDSLWTRVGSSSDVGRVVAA